MYFNHHAVLKKAIQDAIARFGSERLLPSFNTEAFEKQSQFELSEVVSEILTFGFDQWPLNLE